jgi:hypothetical protein
VTPFEKRMPEIKVIDFRHASFWSALICQRKLSGRIKKIGRDKRVLSRRPGRLKSKVSL